MAGFAKDGSVGTILPRWFVFLHGNGRFGPSSQVTALLYLGCRASGSNSVVECQLPKLDVAGSTPVSRSTFSMA